jgi:hypothetical protein
MKDIIFKRIYSFYSHTTPHGKRVKEKKRDGMLLARKNEDGVVEFGFSACHPSDKYSEQLALAGAMVTEADTDMLVHAMPLRVAKAFPSFVVQARRYFQDGKFLND